MSAVTKPHRCGICRRPGHNSRKCPGPDAPPEKPILRLVVPPTVDERRVALESMLRDYERVRCRMVDLISETQRELDSL